MIVNEGGVTSRLYADIWGNVSPQLFFLQVDPGEVRSSSMQLEVTTFIVFVPSECKRPFSIGNG